MSNVLEGCRGVEEATSLILSHGVMFHFEGQRIQ